MKSCFAISVMVIILSACVTLTGDYQLRAFDVNGKPLNNAMVMTAQGRGVHITRNALCAAFPGARIFITDLQTKQELVGESPYQCK